MSSPQNRPPDASRNHPPHPGKATDTPAEAPATPNHPNPKALILTGHGGNETPELERLTHTLEHAGMPLIRRTATPERLGHLLRSMQNQVGCVVLTSGQLRLGSTVTALRETGLPVGILPMNPPNAVDRWIGLPSDPAAAAQLILAGHKRPLDLAMVNGHPFFGTATVGLTLDDAHQLGRAAQHTMGRLAFASHAAAFMLRTGRFPAILRCDGAVHRIHTVQITVGQSHSPTAQPARLFDLYSLEPRAKWGLVFLRKAFQTGNGATIASRREQAAVIEIVTRLPRPITADGAVIAITPARFTILPGAIEVFAPGPIA